MATVSTGMNAQTDGTYYLYDAANKVFLSRGCNWGTEASADLYGTPIVWNSADGSIRPYDWNGTVYMNDGVYMDGGSLVKWTPEANGTGYTLSANGKYLTHKSGTLGEYCTLTDVQADATVWTFMSKADHDAILATYPNNNKTSVIAQAGLTISAEELESTLSGFSATVTNTIAPTAYTWAKPNSRNNANNTNPREVYEGNGTFSYSVTGLKQGIYKVSVPAFFRNGPYAFCNTLAAEADPFFVSTALVKANNEQARIKAWAEDRTGTNNPNSVAEAKTAFDAGKFVNEVYTYVGSDGNLNLTVAVPSFQWGCWFIFGNTTVTYYSDQISAEEAAAAIEKGDALVTQKMEGTLLTALNNALTAFKANQSIANYNALSTAINDATSSSEAYISAKAALEGRAKLVAATNVYTAEALDTYFTTPQAKYDNNTLTTLEAKALTNPYTVSAWRGDPLTNVFMGSAFGVTDFSNAPYTNTWSTEGQSDGSNFLTPFYEYWVSDANSLADKVMTATITGLEPGMYQVSADVRVAISTSKSAPAVGITMNANGGTPATISGTQIGTTPRYLDAYTVYGIVGDDGVLKININVAGTNVSWLAFQNLKYEPATVVNMDETIAYSPAATTGVVKLNRTIVPNVWNTLVLPFDLSAAQVKAAFGDDAQMVAFANTSDNNVEFTSTTTITANVPVLIKAAGGNAFTFEGVTIVSGTPTATGVNWNFVGSYAPATAIAADSYMLQNDKLYKSDGNSSIYYINGFRAYLAPTTVSGAKPMLYINGTPTAIDQVIGNTDKDGNVYNIAGQRVTNAYKGIVIKNGKKTINK